MKKKRRRKKAAKTNRKKWRKNQKNSWIKSVMMKVSMNAKPIKGTFLQKKPVNKLTLSYVDLWCRRESTISNFRWLLKLVLRCKVRSIMSHHHRAKKRCWIPATRLYLSWKTRKTTTRASTRRSWTTTWKNLEVRKPFILFARTAMAASGLTLSSRTYVTSTTRPASKTTQSPSQF